VWDLGIFNLLNYDGGVFWDRFWWVVTGKTTWAPLYLLVIYLLCVRLGWKRAMLAVGLIVAAVGAADLIAGFLKSAEFPWARLRPSHTPGLNPHTVFGYRGGMYGTVSAHAATTAAIAVISGCLVRRRWLNVTLTAYVLMVCYSRIYVAAHFPQDVLLGLLLGGVLGLLAILLWRRAIRLEP
jgi:undecaprenyl-diphosphatase